MGSLTKLAGHGAQESSSGTDRVNSNSANPWPLVAIVLHLVGGACDAICRRGVDSLRQSSIESGSANKQVANSLQDRILHLSKLKGGLEEDMKEISHVIEYAELELKRHEKKLEPNNKAQHEDMLASRRVLIELRNSKDELLADLRGKMKALEIDQSCRRTTPLSASETVRPRVTNANKLAVSSSAPSLPGALEDLRRSPARAHAQPYQSVDPGRFDLKQDFSLPQSRSASGRACGNSRSL